MKPLALLLPALVLTVGCRTPRTELSPRAAAIEAKQRLVADWMLAHRKDVPGGRLVDTEWTVGAWYTGVFALYQQTQDPRYLAPLMAMEKRTGWKVGEHPFFGDDQAIAQTYLDLYRHVKQDPAMIADIRRVVDAQMAAPEPQLGPHTPEHWNAGSWSWCDSLYMAPPAWARLALVTGEAKYLEAMDRKFWKTYDLLYDKQEKLFYRDSNYFKSREANGQKVFWSRGNGWVLGGLVRILEVLPKNHPSRPRYEGLFKEMATRVAGLQQADGFWRPSLLDPGSFPGGESSGSGFFVYAMAWGLNTGLLDAATFRPVVDKGWAALEAAIQPDGRLGWAQAIGQDPRKVRAEDTEVYAVGAFLLAGREMRQLR